MKAADPRYRAHHRLRSPRSKSALQVVLVEPEIPPNTGNIARLCAATSCHLHLVHPLGFRVDEKSVRRAGLDYWHLVELSQHDNWRSFLDSLPSEARLTFFTGKASKSFLEVRYAPGDYLVFGKESSGLADDILAAHEDQLVAIPTIGAVRSLNLANCVALGVYEAMRQLGAFDRTDLQPLQEEPAPTG